jgi:hypothetical protein
MRRNNSPYDETVFRFGAELPKRRMVIKAGTRTADSAGGETGDSQMPALSIFLAFAFVLAGASIAGSAERGLPGIGTFAYSGSSIVTSAQQPIVVAAR